MLLRFSLWIAVGLCLSAAVRAEVLIVADEFPAMQVVADQLKSAEHRDSRLVDQAQLPTSLASFEAVVVYIHKNLEAQAEHAFIDYAKAGGRLVLLHHSISSGKRQNKDWFKFLGVSLPEADVDQGGYKWIEGVSLQLANLSPNHFIMTHQVRYPEKIALGQSDPSEQLRPGFTLHETEVYLNHQLSGPRTHLMGFKYLDTRTGKVWIQDTAGWVRPAGKGFVVYLMPGHTAHDFENPVYGRIVLNAVTASNVDLDVK